jgi:anti-sigma B factor antagonist
MHPAQDDRWQPLTIDERRVDGHFVLEVAGEVDLSSVGELRDALARAAETQAARVVLDLSGVGFMDSTGLTALVLAHRALDVPERRFAVICPEGPVRRLLELAGLDRIVSVHADRAQADGAAD